ncbi:MAG: 2-C-methyl-D-erythritol 2,4-cyclodiphosphate synthase [Brevinematia bacterium]
MIKAGIGYDIHRLVFGKRLVLGGKQIESEWGCEAHSDGDVLIHSIIDAILSPVCGLDIGVVFPDNAKEYKDISSLRLLEIVKKDYIKDVRILSLDSVIILDRPKIALYVPEMKENISRVLGISTEMIGIKGKTSENTRLFSIEACTVSIIDK